MIHISLVPLAVVAGTALLLLGVRRFWMANGMAISHAIGRLCNPGIAILTMLVLSVGSTYWHLDLTPASEQFKVGDRVEFQNPDSSIEMGAKGTVIRGMTIWGNYQVRFYERYWNKCAREWRTDWKVRRTSLTRASK